MTVMASERLRPQLLRPDDRHRRRERNGSEGDTLGASGFSDGDGNNTLTITKVSGAGT